MLGRPLCDGRHRRHRLEKPANHRHERHHRHGSEKTAYLSLFLHDAHHDDDVTVMVTPVEDRHVDTP
jgi:hypothetical protein